MADAALDTMRQLHRSGRNHTWGYYVRNLIRPLWLAQPDHRVDVLIGNPPWLRYSKMTDGMQERYKKLAKERQLLTGGLGASARDLSTLFVVRAIELYLRDDGRFAFVMPHGTLTRKPHTGFRSGQWWSSTVGHLTAAFDVPWDLADVTTRFPMVSCVVHGAASTEPSPIHTPVQKWIGRLPRPDLPWARGKDRITVSTGVVGVLSAGDLVPSSPYKSRFRQGAIIVPRVLLFVEEGASGPLGAGAGRAKVTSRRTRLEKAAWKDVPSLTATVERRFLHPVHLGETTLPFRLTSGLLAVLPLSDAGILTVEQIRDHPGLHAWWDAAEQQWATHKAASDKSLLLERIDYHGQLSAQVPTSPHRVVYTASGNALAAARVDDPAAVIEHKLYWAPANSVDEARYLTAVLNSGTVLDRVKPLQALGLFGGRDFDKNVFAVPIPAFDPADELHTRLAFLAARAEEVAASVGLDADWPFQRCRKEIRAELDKSGVAQQIEDAVVELVPPVVVP